VSDRTYQETIAEALLGLGVERALIVCSDDGLDEISTGDRTRVIELANGRTDETFIAPEDLGIARSDLSAIAGGSPEENAAVVRSVFDGADGPARDVVALNAGAAILVAGQAPDLASAVDRAREAIDSGAARDVVERLVQLTAELAA
jgi:anthranilate phosphoribosyltransferase